MGAQPFPRLAVEDYLALDRAAEHKSEFHDGEMFPIVAATVAHARLASRVASLFESRLKRHCYGLTAMRVRVTAAKFVYPDYAVVCGSPQLTDEHQDTLINPKAVVEVLSPSTADYDRGAKFDLYRQLPSFEEYLLVFQDERRVELLRKTNAERWTIDTLIAPDTRIELASLGVEFPLAELYEGIL